MIKAPWTPEQVAALNWYQTESGWHPFTCGGGEYIGEGNAKRMYCGPGWPAPTSTLIATENGWVCPRCDYTQDWAYELMFRHSTPFDTITNTEAFDG